MPYNHKKLTEKQKYPIIIHGRKVMMSEEQIGRLIRNHMKSNKAIMSVFEDFDVSPNALDELHIEIKDMEGRFAETDETTMSLDTSLFKDGKFMENFFVLAHEIVHFLTRKKESRKYFADEEERQGFVLSVAYEMSMGTDFDTLFNKIYPKIKFHFHNESDSIEFFRNMVRKAKKLLRNCR